MAMPNEKEREIIGKAIRNLTYLLTDGEKYTQSIETHMWAIGKELSEILDKNLSEQREARDAD